MWIKCEKCKKCGKTVWSAKMGTLFDEDDILKKVKKKSD